MQCPRCGCESITVPFKVRRGIRSDVRRSICQECGLVFYTDTKIISVEHYDYSLRKLMDVPIEEFMKMFLPRLLGEQ